MSRTLGDVLKPLIKLGDKPDDCWLWLGKANKRTGYGCKQYGGRTLLAHRWVYQFFNGWIPKGKVINHLCSNRLCVNPRHLEVTSTAGNCRHGKGSKLTADQVSTIKLRLVSAKWGDRQKIAEDYGVSAALISDIKYGRAWVDIQP